MCLCPTSYLSLLLLPVPAPSSARSWAGTASAPASPTASARSILLSRLNCFPDIIMPRTRLLAWLRLAERGDHSTYSNYTVPLFHLDNCIGNIRRCSLSLRSPALLPTYSRGYPGPPGGERPGPGHQLHRHTAEYVGTCAQHTVGGMRGTHSRDNHRS